MEQDAPVKAKKKMCFCRSVKPLLTFAKIFGAFPISVTHKNNECLFKRSKWWLFWSILLTCTLLCHITIYADVLELFKRERSQTPLHSILINIVSALYCVYVILLSILSLAKSSMAATTMTKISSVVNGELVCQSALTAILRLQYAFLTIGLLGVIVQLSALTYLHFSKHYETDFGYKIFVSQFLHNVAFIFYSSFLTYCAIFMGILACLEKMIVHFFHYQPVHLSKNMQETNNNTSFMGIPYKLCKSDHVDNILLKNYRSHEIIDYFRCLHEEICILIQDSNECLNPQLLGHMIVELAVLVVNYYAVVIYFIYDFHSPTSSTIHFLNCLFVVFHTLGILIFLNNSQQLQNKVKGLIPILLEYSTRLSTSEEHQQIRLFVEKLKQHRPLNASGVVNIDLSIAGSICANILTYVLVALQFDVPKG